MPKQSIARSHLSRSSASSASSSTRACCRPAVDVEPLPCWVTSAGDGGLSLPKSPPILGTSSLGSLFAALRGRTLARQPPVEPAYPTIRFFILVAVSSRPRNPPHPAQIPAHPAANGGPQAALSHPLSRGFCCAKPRAEASLGGFCSNFRLMLQMSGVPSVAKSLPAHWIWGPRPCY